MPHTVLYIPLHKLLGHIGQATTTPAVLLTARRAAAKTTGGHADSVANEANGVARCGLGRGAQHALDHGRDAQAEASEQGGQEAAGDEGHDDQEEDLPGVALGPMDQVAEQTLHLLVRLLDEALAGRTLVV